MKRLKKMTTQLLLAAAVLIGTGAFAQSARANCLLSITWENGDHGFVSCGSSAGNYEARLTSSGWETYDATIGTDIICFLYC